VYEEPRTGGVWRDPAQSLKGLADRLQIKMEAERAQLASLLCERFEEQESKWTTHTNGH